MKLNTNISDGNRILFQVYLPSGFPKQKYDVIVHDVECISVRGC
jgi:hypothetical protein